MLRFVKLIVLLLLIGCSVKKYNFQKYGIKKGVITYSLEYPLINQPVEQRVYFTDFGATEYIEISQNEEVPRIIKIDNVEHVFVTDSMTVSKERGFDFIYEKLVKNRKSKLFNKELKILSKSDTIINEKKCELIGFEFHNTGQKGKAALWKGIPLWVNSVWEKGLYENLNLISIDLSSEIPIEKTRIMNYVDVE